MGSKRIVPRRVVKAVPMTEEWRRHLNELAKSRPIDQAHFFEFRSTLEYGPADKDPKEERPVEQRTEANTIVNSRPLQSVQISQPTVVDPPLKAPTPSPSQISPVLPVYSPAMPMSPLSRRRVSFGPPPPAASQQEPSSPVPKPSEAIKVPLLDQRFDDAHGYGKGKRVPKPKVYSVSLNPKTTEGVKWLHVNNMTNAAPPDNTMFIYMGAHETQFQEQFDFTAMQITLEATLKTKQVQDSGRRFSRRGV
eukprot:gene61975-biopygen36094